MATFCVHCNQDPPFIPPEKIALCGTFSGRFALVAHAESPKTKLKTTRSSLRILIIAKLPGAAGLAFPNPGPGFTIGFCVQFGALLLRNDIGNNAENYVFCAGGL